MTNKNILFIHYTCIYWRAFFARAK